MSRKSAPLETLAGCLYSFSGRYESLRGAGSFGQYVIVRGDRADEELLVEPVLTEIVVRLDQRLEVTVAVTPLGKPHREARGALVFRRARAETGRITGDPRRLDLVQELIGDRAPDDLLALALPRDLETLEQLAAERKVLVEGLLAEGRRLVEEVERLVCALYGLPDPLTDEVVEHAAARAARSGPAEDE